MSSLLSLSIKKILPLLKSKRLGASELASLCLERIEKTKELNAFITVTADAALKGAEASQKRLLSGDGLGEMEGIPIALKDNWSTAGIRTTCASHMLSDYTPPYSGTVVQKLTRAGACLVGKTNLDEFAMGSATVDGCFGPTKNPWRSGLKYTTGRGEKIAEDSPLCNTDFFVSGGSSGGAAAAVASGACFAAIGSDTGGSTRNPAALCGVVGLKPTYGLISRHGLIPLCNSLDVPGILTRSVDDAALILGCLAGVDEKDSTTFHQCHPSFTIPDDINIKNFHIGIPKEYECVGMSGEVVACWQQVADLLERSGARVSPVSLPHTRYSIRCYSVLCCCDVASNFARYDGIRYGHRSQEEVRTEHHYAVTRREGFGSVVRERILAGNYFLLRKNYEKYFLKATQVRRLIYNDFQAVFDAGIDLLLTPVTLSEAAPYSHWMRTDNREHNAVDDFCTQSINMAGLPAVSVPCKLSSGGLPIGLQLIGRLCREEELLRAAKWLEQQMDFPQLKFAF